MTSATILVVDDQEFVRRTLHSLLSQQPQWKIYEAENGKIALDRVRQVQPDVVVLDIVMPEMNGMEAAYEIRQLVPSPKIILMSSYYTPEEAALLARLFGDIKFIPKSEVGSALIPAASHLLADESKMVHVLIADDHKFVRDNLRALVAQQQPNWDVSEASNGLEAVELFRKNAPDVAVLDVVMEPLGGIAAAYEIREINPAAKIIFISSHYTVGEASIVIHLLGAGAFVSKTEAVKLLIPTIKRLLNEESQSRA